MGWLSERTATLNDTLGPRRYMLAPLFGAIVGGADWGLQQLAEFGVGALIGVPSWAIGVIATLALVGWWLLEYATQLRRELTPRIELRFGQTEPYRFIERPGRPAIHAIGLHNVSPKTTRGVRVTLEAVDGVVVSGLPLRLRFRKLREDNCDLHHGETEYACVAAIVSGYDDAGHEHKIILFCSHDRDELVDATLTSHKLTIGVSAVDTPKQTHIVEMKLSGDEIQPSLVLAPA